MKLLFVLLMTAFPVAGICEDHHAPDAGPEEHAAAAQAPAAPEHAVPAHAAKGAPHWSYGGEAGPDHWGSLAPDFALCDSGHEQSPVDLKWSQQKGSRTLEFHYQAGTPRVIDNGHTIQVNVPAGSYAVIDGQKYQLAQFHFHAASEHAFSGRHFPLEAHFVHKDAAGRLAVVGVMFDAGRKNEALEKIFREIPKDTGKEVALREEFNPAVLLPQAHTHYQYSGSLTTPPCSEGVNWTVLNSPLELSDEQLDVFNRLYVKNNRPIQPLHERKPANYR